MCIYQATCRESLRMKTNCYNDRLDDANSTHGVDISSQRIDDLEQSLLQHLKQLQNTSEQQSVLDLGCGRCAASNRFAEYSEKVVAVDLHDFSDYSEKSIQFIQQNILDFLTITSNTFDLVLCQRAIHYLPYQTAKQVLTLLAQKSSASMLLGISASGLNSELSQKYPHIHTPVKHRFSKLNSTMQVKHQILEPVCLYTPEELASLVESSGFCIRRVWESEFRNVKILATRN